MGSRPRNRGLDRCSKPLPSELEDHNHPSPRTERCPQPGGAGAGSLGVCGEVPGWLGSTLVAGSRNSLSLSECPQGDNTSQDWSLEGVPGEEAAQGPGHGAQSLWADTQVRTREGCPRAGPGGAGCGRRRGGTCRDSFLGRTAGDQKGAPERAPETSGHPGLNAREGEAGGTPGVGAGHGSSLAPMTEAGPRSHLSRPGGPCKASPPVNEHHPRRGTHTDPDFVAEPQNAGVKQETTQSMPQAQESQRRELCSWGVNGRDWQQPRNSPRPGVPPAPRRAHR